MSFVAETRDLVGTWATKLLLFIITLAIVSVCGWLVLTTRSNQETLIQLAERDSARKVLAQERQQQYLDKMGEVADQLSDVAVNLKRVSENMYPKEQAVKEFDRVNTRVSQIELKQAGFAKDLEYLQQAVN
ncbi:TMhelix containing protein [Vibrio phage vB_VpS_PG28]|nr:TMhelix containing protein [Vibrio phage vB_VpS_PG28]